MNQCLQGLDLVGLEEVDLGQDTLASIMILGYEGIFRCTKSPLDNFGTKVVDCQKVDGTKESFKFVATVQASATISI
jgi:hypothetical protein